MMDDGDLVQEFSRLRLQLLLPLRVTRAKALTEADLAPMLEALDRLGARVGLDTWISTQLAGQVWGTFADLMLEAEHAVDPEAIRVKAWDLHWAIRQVFDPVTRDNESGGAARPPLLALDVLEVARMARTSLLEYVFFWSHEPGRHDEPWPYCLSQWFPARFVLDEREFHSVEQYMMWRKATIFGDRPRAQAILEAGSPREAKALGREVAGFRGEIWRQERLRVVLAGNMAKFSQNGALSAHLLASGDSILVEASPVDRIWGIGLPASHEDARNPLRWRGENLLGFVLMEVRKSLAERQSAGGGPLPG